MVHTYALATFSFHGVLTVRIMYSCTRTHSPHSPPWPDTTYYLRLCGEVLARNADAAGAAATTEEEAAAAARVALSRTVWVGCCNFKPLFKLESVLLQRS
jgi:hypothetical protein